MAPRVSLERCIGRVQIQKIKADRPGFGAPGPQPVSDRLPGILRHQLFQVRLGALVLLVGPGRVRR
jgi:hypothetical protein